MKTLYCKPSENMGHVGLWDSATVYLYDLRLCPCTPRSSEHTVCIRLFEKSLKPKVIFEDCQSKVNVLLSLNNSKCPSLSFSKY